MKAEGKKSIRREEMLDAYIRYSRHRGDARVILKKRLEAILSAFNPNLDRNVLRYFNSGILIDDNCSKSKLKEIEDITGYRLEKDSIDRNSVRKRQAMFEALLIYRVKLEDINHAYDGIFEYSRWFANGVNHTRTVNKEIMNLVKAKVDRVIYLLLGDKYDKTFTVDELREKYGYPNISDSELCNAIINDLPD